MENEQGKGKQSDYKGCYGCLTILAVGEVAGVVFVVAQSGMSVDNVLLGLLQFGPLISVMICLVIALVWMAIHFNDHDDNHTSGGTSTGIDGPRLINWYTRGYVRRSMRRLSRW